MSEPIRHAYESKSQYTQVIPVRIYSENLYRSDLTTMSAKKTNSSSSQ